MKCRFAGCESDVKSKGFCNVHYLQNRRKDYVRYQPKKSQAEKDAQNRLCLEALMNWRRPAGMDEVLQRLEKRP